MLPALPPDLAFSTGNTRALLGWLALAASPSKARWTPQVWRPTGWVLPLLLALSYVALLLGHGGPGGLGSLAALALTHRRISA